MTKINVVDINNKKVKELELNPAVFGIEPHKQAMFDALTMQRASLRQGTHSTKNRSEVAGGGKKPWKQKGTGRARQGSIRSPQWKGGGIVFGPTPRSYAYNINRKVARLALLSALSDKFKRDEIVVIDKLEFSKPSTKEMNTILNTVGAVRKPLLVTESTDENIFFSIRNIEGALNLDISGLNMLDLVNAHKLVLTESSAVKIGEVFGNAK